MEIDEIYKIYCENGDQDLIKYIENIVNEKSMNGQWDRGIEGQSENLTTILLYEYATSIEKLTNGIITSKQVVDKLSNQMGKLRFGDFKDKNDDNVCYDKNSVTSDEYKKKCRIEKHFGAHAPQYTDENGKTRCAIVLFDNKQEFNGMTLSGIDLSDLTDIRHTIFHEWTHVMEMQTVKASELSMDDILYRDGESVYINTTAGVDWSMEEFEDYISSVSDLVQGDKEISFSGISTIEINKKKNPNRRIMHNQIDEGATEFIARKVMSIVDDTAKSPDRYKGQVKIIEKIFSSLGLDKSVATYFSAPQKLLRILERKRIGGVDFLHYISDVVNCSGKGIDLQQFFRDIDIICGELESDKPLEEVTTGDVVKNALSHDIIERARSSERLAEEDYR